MAYSATALRPFGFSQPTRVTPKTDKRAGTPAPSDDSDRSLRPSNSYRKSRTHRPSLSEDLSSSSHWLPPSQQPRAPRHSHGTFPDEEDDVAATPPTRYSAAPREKRRPAHLPSLRHTQHASLVSPTAPAASTAVHKLGDVQLRATSSPSDLPAIREGFSQKQLQEQLKEVYAALRRVEDEREKVLSQMKRGRADQCRVERELEETRRENERLAARLEEMLKLKSPLSARSDDHGWGCSMYDMEALDGY